MKVDISVVMANFAECICIAHQIEFCWIGPSSTKGAPAKRNLVRRTKGGPNRNIYGKHFVGSADPREYFVGVARFVVLRCFSREARLCFSNFPE